MADYNSSYTGAQIDEGIAAARAARIASGLLKSDGSGNVSAAVPGTDYLAPDLGITNASVGQVVTIGKVDGNGKPTAFSTATLLSAAGVSF